MAGRKLKVSLSQIAKEIAKAEKELKKLEKRVSAADKKKIYFQNLEAVTGRKLVRP